MDAFIKGALAEAKKQLIEKIKSSIDKIKNIFTKSEVEEIKRELDYLQPNGEILMVTSIDGRVIEVSKYPARYYDEFIDQGLKVSSMEYEGDEHITFVNEL